MNIQTQETQYNGQRLRYYVFDGDKILFNTDDLFKILNLTEPVRQPEVDLTDAVLMASSSNTDFAMWLNEKFVHYSRVVNVRPKDLIWEHTVTDPGEQ